MNIRFLLYLNFLESLFKLECQACGYEWSDISKSYVCPNCYSTCTKIMN